MNSAISYPSGSAIIREIKRSGVQFVASVPDIVTSDGLLWPLTEDADLTLLRVCKEDEGISICAAMSYNNTRALMLMQQTGLMDSLNAVRALGMDYELPICMMVGLQGKEPHLPANQSKAYGVRIVEPVLNAMGISHSTIDEPADIDHIAAHINRAYEHSAPHCFLIGKPPVYP